MMYHRILLIGFVLICSAGFGQFEKSFSAPLNYSWFNCDPNKNIYAISDGSFLKLVPPYDSSYRYNIQNEGLPTQIDINNPNEIVLFFQNKNKIILLDSNLHEIIRPFYLEEIGIYDASMAFSTNDYGLWFYNNFNNSLSKLDKNFLLVNRSVNMNPYFEPPNTPNYVLVFENKIYLNVPSHGILILGPNGEYQTAMHLPGLIDFQIDRKAVYFYRDHIIYCYNYRSLKFKKIYIPYEPDILNAWFFDTQILVLKKDGFIIYDHNINPIDETH